MQSNEQNRIERQSTVNRLRVRNPRRVAAAIGVAVLCGMGVLGVTATPASAATSSTLLYSTDGGATWSANLTAEQGQQILVRQWYDNPDAQAYGGSALTTTVPAGFTLVPSSTRVCISPATTAPASSDPSQDVCAAQTDSVIWSGSTLTVSPTSGLYGQPVETVGVLNQGLARYLNLQQCTYRNAAGDSYTLASANPANAAQGSPTCGSVGGYTLIGSLSDPLSLTGNRYLNFQICSYKNAAGDTYTTLDGANTSNTKQQDVNCPAGRSGYFPTVSSLTDGFSLLGVGS
jgi:hypothetical protein